MRSWVSPILLLLFSACAHPALKTDSTAQSPPANEQSGDSDETKTVGSESGKTTNSDGKKTTSNTGTASNGKTNEAASKSAAANQEAGKKKASVSDYEPIGEPSPAGLVTAAPQTVKLTIPLQLRQCYSFAVLLDKDMQSDTITIFDPAGAKLHQGPIAASQKTESLCATSTGSYKVEIHVIKGLGKVTLQTFKLKPPVQWAASTEIRQQLTAYSQNIAEGQPAVSPVYTMYAVNNQSAPQLVANFLVKLERSACYDFVCAADSGVEELHLALMEPDGHKVLEDQSPAAKKHFSYCVDTNGLYRTEFNIVRGAGEVAFQVFQSPAKYIPQTKSQPARRVTPPAPAPQAQPPASPGRWPTIPRF